MRLLIKAGANRKTAKEKRSEWFYEPDPDEDADKEIVSLRNWRDTFEWTPENTQKIIAVIQGIDRKVNEMYDKVEKVNAFLQSDAFPNKKIKEVYMIEAKLSYENWDVPLPSADEKMMQRLYDATNWDILPSVHASDGEMESRADALYLGENLNWDIEGFDRPELEHVKIPYYVHALFVDAHTYTLTDMMHMNPNDFYISMEFTFDGESV